jgi:hypothetical protein
MDELLRIARSPQGAQARRQLIERLELLSTVGQHEHAAQLALELSDIYRRLARSADLHRGLREQLGLCLATKPVEPAPISSTAALDAYRHEQAQRLAG